MPRMNSYELVKKTKQTAKQVKIVLVTALEINDKGSRNVLPDIKVGGFSSEAISHTAAKGHNSKNQHEPS
jgi:CheY-like chemotaxis protein